MRKDLIILLAVLIPAAIIILLVGKNFSSNQITNPFAAPSPYPTISSGPTATQSPTTLGPTASENIEVLTPRTGDIVESGFRVEGNARTFESTVNIRLTDSEKNVLSETFTMADASDAGQFGPFEKVINFKTDSANGTLEVFQYSAKDGSEIDKVVIPLQFIQ